MSDFGIDSRSGDRGQRPHGYDMFLNGAYNLYNIAVCVRFVRPKGKIVYKRINTLYYFKT